jgi:hypothetical protein
MIFAQGLLDFGMSETVLHIIRIIASVGGAIVGWFVCDPLTRLAYRLSFRGTTPGVLLFGAKLTGAAGLALLVYFYLPLGGGGGFGWGPGQGGGPGKGTGAGSDKPADPASKDAKDRTGVTPLVKDTTHKGTLESMEIEIISRDRFIDKEKEDRFYLLRGAEPAKSFNELDAYLKENGTKLEVTPVLTRDSIPDNEKAQPLAQLLALTKKYKIKTLQTKGP